MPRSFTDLSQSESGGVEGILGWCQVQGINLQLGKYISASRAGSDVTKESKLVHLLYNVFVAMEDGEKKRQMCGLGEQSLPWSGQSWSSSSSRGRRMRGMFLQEEIGGTVVGRGWGLRQI